VGDLTAAIEEDRANVVDLDSLGGGNGHRVVFDDVDPLVEEGVDTQAIGLMAGRGVRHYVGWIAVRFSVGPGALTGGIVGQLALIEDGFAAVAVPQNLLLLVVLDEETERGDIVAVDDEAVVRGIYDPSDSGAMVGAPRPDVVEQDVVAVDFNAGGGASCSGTADAEEDVAKGGRI